MPNVSRPMKRRRFVQLVALSSAATLTGSLGRAAADPERRPRAASRRAPTAAAKKEIANQEKSLADQLKTIRSYTLPPGSPQAFVFVPLRAKRRT